ncbi:protein DETOXIFICATION 48-like [Corylus avellana]|uniref:protein DETOXIFICATION 48-like n=1 Tax=Corylus avellana TaxID=13451 RepID=UPI00286D1CC1|nr:protein DETOXIFICATION 48-like [Corylus avellana]
MYEDAPSAPLLSFYNSSKLEESAENDELGVEQDSQYSRPTLSEVVEEIKQLYIIAIPMILTGLFIYGKSAISMFFMGKIGKEALAGGSLAISIANISGYSVISGLAMGMEGISSQACGAKQWHLMGLTLQRTIIILCLACIPISFLWLNFQPILLFWGQNPTISSIAATYLAFSLPDLLFQSLINPLKIFLRTQEITLPLMLTAAFSLALHAPITSFIVHHLDLGIRSIALAGVLTDLNLLVMLLLYICFSGTCRKSWQGWSRQCFKEWKPILDQAIPSCISVCLEWWWYEIMILLSGILTNAAEAVATMGILIQATSLVYNFPIALNQAVSTRVGNELGANRPYKAKKSSIIALSCAVFTGLMAMLFMITMRNAWGRIFTADKAILSLTAAAMPVVGLCELGNCPQTTVCGVLRGSARPSLGAYVNLGSFYGVGLPFAVFMGFGMDMGLLGLWLGLLAAQMVCAAIMVLVLSKTDWMEQVGRAEDLTSIHVEDQHP